MGGGKGSNRTLKCWLKQFVYLFILCVSTNPLRFECQKLVLVGDPKVCETVVACCLLVFQSSYAPVAYPDNGGFPRHAKNGEKKTL